MTPTRTGFRPCTGADLPAVRALLDDPLGELYPGGRAWLDRRLAGARTAGRLTVTGPSGMPDAVAIETWKPGGRVKLSTFFVRPGARHAGVGTALALSLVGRWRAEARDDVYVTVAADCAPALSAVLLPVGFTLLAVKRERYGPGRDEHVLAWFGHGDAARPEAGEPARR